MIPKRGEIDICKLGARRGSVQSGRRPVLVIQDSDVGKHSPTTIIAPITSVLKKPELPGHILLPDTRVLNRPSMVILEQMQTVNVSQLEYLCGALQDDNTWKQINDGIRKVLGIWCGHNLGFDYLIAE